LYDQHLLKQLKPALESQLLPAADRYGVISDMWAVVAAGHTDTAVALEMVATLRSEPDYFVLVALLNGFGDMLAIVEDEALRDQLKIFGRWLVRGHYERLGWQARATDSHFDILLRAAILMAAVKFEVTGASDEAQRLFVDYARGGSLDANVRAAVLYGVAHRGGVAEYEQLLALYRRETAPQARQAQLVNLGRFQDPALAARTLDWSLSNEVKSQDLVYGLSGVWRTRAHRDLACQHLQQSWPQLVERFGDGGHMLDRFPEFAGSAFATHAQADDVEAFFARNHHVMIDRPAAQAVESIRLKADWYNRDRASIQRFAHEWLQENKAFAI
jgi:puromycin-sensitive aminopeptidase